MVERIVAAVDPEKVILFGSHARGEARPDSDVDLLVVEKTPFSRERSRWAETNRLHLALRGCGMAKDVLLYSEDEYKVWRNSLNHVVGRACREGRVLYERH